MKKSFVFCCFTAILLFIFSLLFWWLIHPKTFWAFYVAAGGVLICWFGCVVALDRFGKPK